MCTVTYIPLKGSALFSSCRDENPGRSAAIRPMIVAGKNMQMLYPADGLAKGTWAGINNNGQLIILLNGGFETHEKKAHYRLSRGQIVKQLLDSLSPVEEWLNIDLEDIEPFTLIAYKAQQLYQLVWTGSEKILLTPDAYKPYIWSSATLYNSFVQEKRSEWFRSFLHENPQPSPNQLLQYLLYDAPVDAENGFIMNRNEAIKTCSVSIIAIQPTQAIFTYNDLLKNTASNDLFPFDHPSRSTHIFASIAEKLPADID